jgi:hypothetical protein
MLAKARYRASLVARLVWSAFCWQARRDLAMYDQNAAVPDRNLVHAGVVRFMQIYAGARQRLYGSRLGASFQVGKLTETQRTSIEELGYTLCVETSQDRRRLSNAN